MNSAIKEIYNRDCTYNESIQLSEEYHKVEKQYNEIYEKLLKSANAEQKKWLDNLFGYGTGLESKIAETHFIEGFKLGLRLATECLK